MLAAEAPKITDWMQAWGSLAGLVMSTAAVIFTGLLFRHEIRVRREDKEDGEATQARLIIGTARYLPGRLLVEFVRDDPMDKAPLISGSYVPVGREPSATVAWEVANHSPSPVFAVRIWVYCRITNSGVEWPETIGVLKDSCSGRVEIDGIDMPLEQLYETYGITKLTNEDFYVKVIFTDSTGLHWVRTDLDPPQRIYAKQKQRRFITILRTMVQRTLSGATTRHGRADGGSPPDAGPTAD